MKEVYIYFFSLMKHHSPCFDTLEKTVLVYHLPEELDCKKSLQHLVFH